MATGGSRLGTAHKGYIYQDQATSFVLVMSLLERFDEVIVDRKEIKDDRFDDLAVRHNSRLVRRQFKASDDPGLAFKVAHLGTITNRNLTIDALVRSYTRAGDRAADEYRLCTTWRTPTDPADLQLLEPIQAEPSFPGHPSKTFRLRAETIWPDGETPLWHPLQRADDFTREDFLEFARRFVIELECPLASRDFSKPGPLETLILNLLADSVGIGRYPNQNRSLVDVAALLQQFAARARSASLTVTPPEVERELQLRRDFGRVEQQFPVVKTAVVKRPSLRDEIARRLGSRRVIVVGPPGSGKSWELTGLADDLAAGEYLVARHYCYLEPGDPEVQRRITTNVMFANLIYELIRANPALEQLHRPVYSAGARELEDLLRKGTERGLIDKAVLVVDGIDHVSRVFAEATGVAKEDVDIVEELATLNLPEGVCLIVGSQPGKHLEPLGEDTEYVQMPAWRFIEVAALARRLGVPSALRDAGLGESVRGFLEQLHERSEGNPLYATFLCRQTLELIAKGGVFDPIAALHDAPLTGGDISLYYGHLLNTAESGRATALIAELLGLVDFALTVEELKEIHPWMRHNIDDALSQLAPVLTPARARGGVRIYHESFRRYINERLRSRGGSTEDVLDPVIRWLDARDFFGDPRAYRFLLPALRRAGRHEDLLRMVTHDFVSRSVEAGHSEAAVEQNLFLATYVAAERLDWAALTRCVELHKSCTVCFQDKLTDYDPYGRAFVAVHGPDALADRMLFDGRPTYPVGPGLIFCSLCDDEGAVPPWEQYLSLARRDGDESVDTRNPKWVSYLVAEAHGAIRRDGVEAVYSRVVSWLGRSPEPHPEYLRGILRRLIQFGGLEILPRLMREVRMYPETESLVRTELAQALADAGRREEAAAEATEAVRKSSSPSLAAECLALGADRTEVAKRCPSLDRAGAGLDEEKYHPDEADVRLWVDGVRIAALTDPGRLAATEGNIRGEGWYKNWLRYVIALSRAEEQAATDPAGAEANTLAAFRLLASDTAPFKGKPRACDLYSVCDVVHETFKRGLRLLRTPASLETALACLAKVSGDTTTSLQNSPGGPLIPEAFMEMLMPFVRDAAFKDVALAEMVRQHRKVAGGGELYDTVASADLLLARASAEGGDADAARRLWKSAAVHLCAYGFRREVSIFDLTDGAASLGGVDRDRAAHLLAAAQPLVNAVDEHTDGKETQYAPARWVDAVAAVAPADGAYILGRSLIKRGGIIDWRHEDALRYVIAGARPNGNPSLIAFLDATLPFAGDDKALGAKLSTITRLLGENADAGRRMLRIVAAKLRGDTKNFSKAAYERVRTFAESVGVSLHGASSGDDKPTETEAEDRSYAERSDPFNTFKDSPVFQSGATPLALMTAIRSARRSMTEADKGHDRLVNAFGYRLVELIDRGDEDEAVRLLKSFARETFFWEGATALADLAEGLERQGHPRAAAVAFSLAYARSRGMRGNLHLGDESHLPWLLRAGALSQEIASRSLAEEVAHILNQERRYLGITRHLIKALAAQEWTREAAFEAWEAAYQVIGHRLPENGADPYIFEAYDLSAVPTWSLDEALSLLLLARTCHPELGRKTAAAAGLAYLISTSPRLVSEPIRQFLNTDTPVSSALLVLQTLLLTEVEPYEVTATIQDELRSLYRSGLFGLRVMADMLLERSGLDPGERQRYVALTAEPIPARKAAAVLSLDWGARVRNISRMWPEFPAIVSGRFYRVWEGSKAQRERAHSRREAATSRLYEDLPWTSMLLWEEELFEMFFHEVLDGVDTRLWETGAWDPEIFPWLLGRVLPRLPLHVARWYSRVPRPPLPLPARQRSATAPVVPVTGEGEFDGWYRCGYFEREIVIENSYRVDETITVASSVHLSDTAYDPEVGPLAEGEADFWLAGYGGSSFMTLGTDGPVAAMEFVKDWLGEFPLLMLRQDLQIRLGLSPRKGWQDRLELVDESGRGAVVFRYWAENPAGDSIGDETPRLQGCDLLVRPDVFVRITGMIEGDPVTVTYSSRGTDDAEEDEVPSEPEKPAGVDSGPTLTKPA